MGSFVSRPLRALLISAAAIALVVACGSEGTSGFGPGSVDEDGGGSFTPFTPPGGDDGGGVVRSNCIPRTCAEQGIECGPAGDGCGGLIPDCGTCGDGLRCGGPNAPSKCVSMNVATDCTPKTCAELGVECGLAGDGCGAILQCPTCPSGQQCGGPGAPSQCVSATVTGPDGGACAPKTIADYNAEGKDCGPQSNGCGGTINLGTCVAPEFCGGGGPSKCAVPGGGTCTPKTCADYPGTCGPQPNGCGGVTATNCGTCTLPKVCGGGGTPSVCGGGGVAGPDGGTCSPITCGPSQCGIIANGCGGTLDCGTSKCTAGQVCGGAGTPNLCAPPPCTPIGFCPAGMNCGSIANGCGGTLACGPANACTNGAICGGGGKPNVCGGGSVVADGGGACNPITACQPNQCGPIPNGCGGIVQCPQCTGGAICGGGGAPSVCAGGTCTPRTAADCATLGVNCGFIADGCGGPAVQCGATCPNGGICGLNTPNVCSTGGATCTNLCVDQPTNCSGPNTANTTTITGTVYMPNGTLPVYDALVYVPNAQLPLPAVPAGIGTCDSCSAPAAGDPLISTRTNSLGKFTLTNMPHRAGGVPVVIQAGRWRKVITVTTSRCGTVNLSPVHPQPPTTNNTTFGSTQTATNNIPKFAVTTGGADALQCLMRKIGIADSEFTQPGGLGRVNLYAGVGGTSRYRGGNPSFNGYTGTGNWTPTTQSTRNFPNQTYLFGDADDAVVNTSHLNPYDAVLLTCEGQNDQQDTFGGYRAEMKAYADSGGRVFASHWHHAWIEYGPNTGASPWGTGPQAPAPPAVPIATINHQGNPANPITATINTGFPKGSALATWLRNANTINGTPAATLGQLSISESRATVTAVDTTRATSWITIPNSVQYFDFNTPLNVAPQCGRFVNSDLHVAAGDSSGNGSGNNGTSGFPNNCTSDVNVLSDQEKVLAFMLFDLTSCVSQPDPPKCTKRTCANYPAGTCGQQSDGCGGLTTNCGTCVAPKTCGGGGTPSQCGNDSSCTPKTCAAGQCGQIPNGCGQLLTCPNCPAGQTCGGGGVANQCGAPTCTPKTCAQLGVGCGQTGNGCGGIINCGNCQGNQTCGGGGVPNQCGGPSCTPLTQCPAGKNCGTMPNGCGGVITCGTCPNGQSCGGGGSANTCGAASCSPKTCAMLGAQCGVVSDQCGGTDTCAPCAPGQFCNAQNVCVAPTCKAKTCAELGVECGPVGNTCGGLLSCGSCPVGTGCGAGGVPGKCGTNPCTPKTCVELDAQCGQVANGCGGLTPNCGSCPGSTSCSNGVCVQACTPRTCAQAGANCGLIADGCGGTVDCGLCAVGEECGFGGLANVCGSNKPK
jgi:hypothetical protein